MSIFITGDTHADFRRFGSHIFYEQKDLCKEDYVIICGDFGGVWDGSFREKYWLDWLGAKPFTTLFISGNHENYDMLSSFPVEEWHGGHAQFIRPSVIHLMRGQIFNLEGQTFFTMGGASSHDVSDGILEPDDPDFPRKHKQLNARGAMYRVNHVSWWKEELPCEAEYQEALEKLENHGWKVDYIISHCCPTSIQDILGGGLLQADALTDFFEDILHKCKFQEWFFGHYHENFLIMEKFILLYEQMVRLNIQQPQ